MIVCGTGHRPDKLGGYGADVWNRLVDLASFWLRNVRPDHVISGMALGWDQALALAALNTKIPFTAYIPFVDQAKVWPESSKVTYEYLMEQAHHVEICSEPGYAAWKMQHRNKRMVDDSHAVLALWDGSEGGTANCIAYANRVDKQVVNLWPVYSMITRVNSSQ